MRGRFSYFSTYEQHEHSSFWIQHSGSPKSMGPATWLTGSPGIVPFTMITSNRTHTCSPAIG